MHTQQPDTHQYCVYEFGVAGLTDAPAAVQHALTHRLKQTSQALWLVWFRQQLYFPTLPNWTRPSWNKTPWNNLTLGTLLKILRLMSRQSCWSTGSLFDLHHTHKYAPTWRSHRLFCWTSTLRMVLYMQAFYPASLMDYMGGGSIHGAVQRETWSICNASCLNPVNGPDSSLTSCLLIEWDGSLLGHRPDAFGGNAGGKAYNLLHIVWSFTLFPLSYP